MSKNQKKIKNPDYKLAKEQFYELNKEFYDYYLDDYYSMKIINLLSLITNTKQLTTSFIDNPIEISRLKIETQAEDIKSTSLVKYAKIELAITYYHCLETFIRLFIAHAKLSECPWLELSRLNMHNYKIALKKIKDREFNSFNNKLSGDETILFVFTSHTKEINEGFLEGYKKWLQFSASQLLETYDYNSFKHGLAISPTQNGLTIGKPNEEVKLEAHGDVIEHLAIMNNKDRIIWAKYTNFIKYDEKAAFILYIEDLMKNILAVGKGVYLEKEEKEELNLLNVSKILPEVIQKSEDDSFIGINGFKRGLLYYK